MKSQDRRRLGALLFSQLEPYIRRKCTGILPALGFVLFPFTLLPASFANRHLKVSWPCRLRLCQHKHDGRAFLPERRPNVYLPRSGEVPTISASGGSRNFLWNAQTFSHFPRRRFEGTRQHFRRGHRETAGVTFSDMRPRLAHNAPAECAARRFPFEIRNGLNGTRWWRRAVKCVGHMPSGLHAHTPLSGLMDKCCPELPPPLPPQTHQSRALLGCRSFRWFIFCLPPPCDRPAVGARRRWLAGSEERTPGRCCCSPGQTQPCLPAHQTLLSGGKAPGS